MPGQILVMDQQVVCPGDLLAEGDFEIPWSPYVYKESNRYFASVVGVVDVKNGTFTVIPLKGSKYWPRVGDTVLGMVEEIELYGWTVDIRAPYPAYLPASSLLNRPVTAGEDLRRYLDVGDYIVAKVEVFDRTTNPILAVRGSDTGKVTDGTVVSISPSKASRLIGRNRSLLNTLVSMTGCHLMVYPNGMIHMRCPSSAQEEAIKGAISLIEIEQESRISDLMEKVRRFIASKLGETNVSSSAEA